ncbi:uncharacterized protein ISCGN_015146 [Ixodes scapularis]
MITHRYHTVQFYLRYGVGPHLAPNLKTSDEIDKHFVESEAHPKQATELAPEMAARTPVDAAVDAVAEETCEVEEIQALLHPTSAMQVTLPNYPSDPPTSKKPNKKSHRRKRRGSEVHSEGKYSTNSPSSSTVNDEILPLNVAEKSSAPVGLTIEEASTAAADPDIPAVLVDPPSKGTSCAPSRDEEILEALRDIVRKCTVQDPDKRASAAEVYATLEKLL